MPRTVTVSADLGFEVTLPGATRPVRGHLRGSAPDLELWIDDPAAFAGRGDRKLVRAAATAIAGRGMRVTVTSPAGRLVTLGAARASWLQRHLTGSAHIVLARPGALAVVWRNRGRRPALPGQRLAPPTTPYPLAPTFLRRRRRAPTTTHAGWGSGEPRLVAAPHDPPWPGERRRVVPLGPAVTTVGSDPGCDVVLAGLAARHAEIRHNRADEFVLVPTDRTAECRVNGEPVTGQVLRTGSRVELGEWTFSFVRDEYADHGRPYGGRAGGEFSHQRTQPPRPTSGSAS